MCVILHFKPLYLLDRVLYLLLLTTATVLLVSIVLAQVVPPVPQTSTETGWPKQIESLGLLTVLSGITWLLYRRDEKKDKRIQEMQTSETDRLIKSNLDLREIISKQDDSLEKFSNQIINQQTIFGKSMEQSLAIMERIAATLATVKDDHRRMLDHHEEHKQDLSSLGREINDYLLKGSPTSRGSAK